MIETIFRAITALVVCSCLLYFSNAYIINVKNVSLKGFKENVVDRIDRTMELGIEDSSLQTRYIIGTDRFFKYAIKDPTIIPFGIGIQTLSGYKDRNPDWYLSNFQEHQFGFVSNSWLLVIWIFGIFGFIGLFKLHYHLYIYSPTAFRKGAVIISALIFLSDNYAVYSPKCFFLLMAFLGTIWGINIRFSEERIRIHNISRKYLFSKKMENNSMRV